MLLEWNGFSSASITVHPSLEFAGLLLLAFLSPVLMSRHYDRRRISSIATLMLLLSVMLSFDFQLSYCISHEMTNMYLYFWFIVSAMMLLVMYYFNHHLAVVLPGMRDEMHSLDKLQVVCILPSVLFLATNILTGAQMSFSPDGSFYLGPAYAISILLFFIPFIISAVILVRHGHASPRSGLLWAYSLSFLAGAFASLMQSEIAFNTVFLAYGFVFLFCEEFLYRVDMVGDVTKSIEERHAVGLSSQLAPHFLFNALTSIMNLPGNNERSREALDSFGVHLRHCLDAVTLVTPIPVAVELGQASDIAEVLKLSYGDKLEFGVRARDDGFSVPSMISKSVIAPIVSSYPPVSVESLSINVIAETVGNTHFLIFRSSATPSDNLQCVPQVVDESSVRSVSDRVGHMCGGRVVSYQQDGNDFEMVIEVPGVSS